MAIKSGIYEPPKRGMPYLAVFVRDGRVDVHSAPTRTEAETLLKQHAPIVKAAARLEERYATKKEF